MNHQIPNSDARTHRCYQIRFDSFNSSCGALLLVRNQSQYRHVLFDCIAMTAFFFFSFVRDPHGVCESELECSRVGQVWSFARFEFSVLSNWMPLRKLIFVYRPFWDGLDVWIVPLDDFNMWWCLVWCLRNSLGGCKTLTTTIISLSSKIQPFPGGTQKSFIVWRISKTNRGEIWGFLFFYIFNAFFAMACKLSV